MEQTRRQQLADVAWLMAWGIVSSVWCVTAAGQLSATFDEPLYIERGLECWRTGSHAGLMQLGTMPLPIDVTTLPLYLWERWRGIPWDAGADLGQLLPVARAGTLVFWWLLLVYGLLLGRSLVGSWGGRLAVALLACEPCLLAHAGLVTTDLAISACLVALVYHYRQGREAGWGQRVGLPAVWFAAAVLAKASGLVYGPLCLLAIELECRLRAWRARSASDGGQVARLWACLVHALSPRLLPYRDLAQIGLLGMVLVFVYCGCDWRPQKSFVAWAHQLPETRPNRMLVWLSDHLCIFSNAGEGLVRQVRHNIRGHSGGAYLLGTELTRPVWYYYPLALSMKLSATLLTLPILLLCSRRRALMNGACLAALILLLYSLNCRVQIGIRFMLPLVALGAIGLAAAAVTAGISWTRWKQRAWQVGLSLGVLLSLATAALAWPQGLCYTNVFWGGTDEGYYCLSDSNYDWGQGLKELTEWQRCNGVSELSVWYFGTDPAINRDPLRYVPLHIVPLEDLRITGRLAVSTTLLHGVTMTEAHRRAAALLRSRQPIARTATFFIYDLEARSAPPGKLGG